MALVSRATLATGAAIRGSCIGRAGPCHSIHLETLFNSLSFEPRRTLHGKRNATGVDFVRTSHTAPIGSASRPASSCDATSTRAIDFSGDATFRLVSTGPRSASQLRSAYEYFEKLLTTEKDKREHSGQLTDRVDAHKARDAGRCLCAGDRKMLEVDRMLHALKINYSRDQLMFFANMKEAVMPAVYKNEWEDNAARVMEMYNLERVGRFLAINTPRRFGKTTAVAAFVVSLLIGSPGIEVCVFSTGGRASGSLMETAKRMMSVMPSLQRRVCKEDVENLYVCEAPLPLNCGSKSEAAHRARSLHSTSRLHSFPDSVEDVGQTTLKLAIGVSTPNPNMQPDPNWDPLDGIAPNAAPIPANAPAIQKHYEIPVSRSVCKHERRHELAKGLIRIMKRYPGVDVNVFSNKSYTSLALMQEVARLLEKEKYQISKALPPAVNLTTMIAELSHKLGDARDQEFNLEHELKKQSQCNKHEDIHVELPFRQEFQRSKARQLKIECENKLQAAHRDL